MPHAASAREAAAVEEHLFLGRRLAGGVGAVLVSVMLLFFAQAQAANARIGSPYTAKDACDYVLEGMNDNRIMFEEGRAPSGRSDFYQANLVRFSGVIDLDGDGTMEIVTPASMGGSIGGDDFQIYRREKDGRAGEEIKPEIAEPFSGLLGVGLLSFNGRWYVVKFGNESAVSAFEVSYFEPGLKTRTPLCTFKHSNVQGRLVTQAQSTSEQDRQGLGVIQNALETSSEPYRLKPYRRLPLEARRGWQRK